ncbi:hypothetical protein MY11210_003126 [Beauveria gryllotalpidicola]
MSAHVRTLALLQASVDLQDESEFRMLVDNQHVKYITIDGGLYSVDDMCFEPILTKILPPFPPGDWNMGRVSRDPLTGKAHFASVSKEKLAEIQTAWHAKRVEHLQLEHAQKLRSNVNQVTCPGFAARVVVAKFARFEWEIPQLEAETEAYGWLQNHSGIAPEFLAHLTEDGRVIGFLIASVADCRHATPDDWALCRDVLGKLHKLGIKHGDVNKHNFLIHCDEEGQETATLIDFDMATRNATKEERDAEMEGLRAALEDTSGRGGAVTVSSIE